MVLSHKPRSRRTGFVEPCLPSPAKAPPSGPGWIHEIKHDGFRIIARRDARGVRLVTRNGNDFSARFPNVAAAVNALPVRSCLIDGEAIVTDDRGLAVFEMICNRRYEAATVLCAFDLIELDGEDLRRAPLELRTTLPAHAEPVDVCARYGGHRVNFMRGHHAMWRCDYPRHR